MLGKRDQPMTIGGDAPTKQPSKKRDSKDRDTNISESAPQRKVRAGDFENFSFVQQKTFEVLRTKGIRQLFPIQTACFAPVYHGKDLIARDLAGSGKTLAYGLPLVERLRATSELSSGKLQAIIMTPTKELALQITNELQKLKHSVEDFRIVTVYGAVSIINQANALKSGVDILVGTTARILEHIERGNIDFSGVKTVVIDEADNMLKMDFSEDITKIMEKCKEDISQELQTLVFTSSMPDSLLELAKQHMRGNRKTVDLAKDLSKRTARNITHLAVDCHSKDRVEALAKVLKCYGGNGRIIVFTSTKQDANSLLLSNKISMDVEAIHGDIAKNSREITMQRFKDGKFQVLVATEVVSRALEIPEVELVIQLDPPKDAESYIYRSGKTVRAGRMGTCITFFNERSADLVEKIEDAAGVTLTRIGVPTDEDMIKANTRGVLTKLQEVDHEILPIFEDTAELMIQQCRGDVSKAVQIALAFASGHYKLGNPDESLITGRMQQVTIKMAAIEEGDQLSVEACYAILERFWAPRISDSVEVMKPFSDGSGVAFDIRSQWVEGFMDNYTYLADGRGGKLAFELVRAKSLPKCDEDVAKPPKEELEEGEEAKPKEYGDDFRKAMGGKPMKCHNCQEEGHKAEGCTNEKVEPPPRAQKCFNCQEEGHRADDCTNEAVERIQKCFNCQQEGHRADDCTEEAVERPPMKCFKCQEEGHMSRECPNQ